MGAARGAPARGALGAGRGLSTRACSARARWPHLATLDPGGVPASCPVNGRAWITGEHAFRLNPADPFPQGYQLPDTWGRGAHGSRLLGHPATTRVSRV